MKDTIIFLSMSSNITYNKRDVCKGPHRIEQYVNGLVSFFKYIKPYADQCDILLFDNTVSKNSHLDPKISDIVPKDTFILHDAVNKYGPLNKGAGIIEQWTYCGNIVKNYKWVIHFEPRQLLIGDDFFRSFFSEPQSLFQRYTVGNRGYVWTGLFSIETERLQHFCKNYTPEKLSREHLNLENAVFDHSNGKFKNVENLNLVWFDFYANKEYKR